MAKDIYAKLRIPVHTVEIGQDIVHKFPELQQYEEFSRYKEKDRNDVIRYVVYAYDPESPHVKNSTSELSKRKEAAAEAAGFERNKKTGLFGDNICLIMNLKDEEVNKMIFCYLKMLNTMLWTQIVTDEQGFWEYTKLLMQPLEHDDDKKLMDAANVKGKLREERNKIKVDLDKYYKEFYGDNSDLEEKTERYSPETVHKHYLKKI